MAWRLVNETTGEPVEHGSEVKTFRGETMVLTGGTPPHKPSSTGRVSVRPKSPPDSSESNFQDSSLEFYPNVVGLKWVETKES